MRAVTDGELVELTQALLVGLYGGVQGSADFAQTLKGTAS